VGVGALARERECCAGGGCVRTGLHAGGGACGLAAREAYPTEALHLGAPAPRSGDPTAAVEQHLPPCTARGRPSRLPGALYLCACGTGARTPPGPVHARGAAPVEASGIHALCRRGTACSHHHHRHGRGCCEGPAGRGGRSWWQ
jgi:hypothetical protein